MQRNGDDGGWLDWLVGWTDGWVGDQHFSLSLSQHQISYREITHLLLLRLNHSP